MSKRRSGRIPRSAKAAAIDEFESVRALARIADEFDLSEVEVDPSGRIRVARNTTWGSSGAPSSAAVAPAHAGGGGGLALMPPVAEAVPDKASAFITSPFVGTFYRSPSPEAEAFVEVGQAVRKGQVVCIVEAMKLMNEIESEFDGKVLEVMVTNGTHVEYGQPLYRLEKR
jgi:acetyl-CoA carboxylase biotin carboxyl carrier protein